MDNMVENLASVGPILHLAELEHVIGPQWAWFGQYGDDLLAALLGMSIPPRPQKSGGQSDQLKVWDIQTLATEGGRNKGLALKLKKHTWVPRMSITLMSILLVLYILPHISQRHHYWVHLHYQQHR